MPRADDPDLLDAFRAALRAADFTVERVESELGTHAITSRPTERLVNRRRLRNRGGSFGALARLFLLEDEVEVSELDPALGTLGLSGLAALGLCEVEASVGRATAMLLPHGDYYLAFDCAGRGGADAWFDYVPGVQAPSVTLAKLAVRDAAGAALDLGTGSGLQALLAAKHCRSVVATDINERALRYAAFNARLNGLTNIELRQGRTFDPVEGERFDLIVCNPPYVISPEHAYAYRDSDIPGEQLCREIVQELPQHLDEGGFAHVLVSWTHRRDEPWHVPLREWLPTTGCDAWLLHYRSSDPLDHAHGWLRPLGERDPAAFAAALDHWLVYLRDRGIEAVGYGAIVLRRRHRARNWVRTDQLPLEGLEPASGHIVRSFSGTELLSELEEERGLLGHTFRLTPEHRLRQELRFEDGALSLQEATLELTDGLRFSVGLDRYTMLLLPHLDGSRSLGQALERASAELDLTEEARRRYVPAALPVIRRLLELGFLERVGGG